jgi:hypothetical protein
MNDGIDARLSLLLGRRQTVKAIDEPMVHIIVKDGHRGELRFIAHRLGVLIDRCPADLGPCYSCYSRYSEGAE